MRGSAASRPYILRGLRPAAQLRRKAPARQDGFGRWALLLSHRSAQGQPFTRRLISSQRYACLRPADPQRQDALQEIRIFEPVMLSRRGELLALGDLGVGIGLDEIRRAIGGEAKIDARVAIEAERPVDA